MGVAGLVLLGFREIGRMVWPEFAAALRGMPPSRLTGVLLLSNSIAYTIFGLAILRGKRWGFWGYVIYVPLLGALVMGSKYGHLIPINWFAVGVYVLFVVLLSRPAARSYLHLDREGAAT